jgi:hypothetical protein
LPTIIKKTNLVDEYIRVMASWHFVDVCSLPTEHEAFDDETLKMMRQIEADIKVV